MPEAVLKTDRSKLLIACTINLLAVSTVFMTQSIFLELSESFKIGITQARFSFSIVSIFYAASFFFLGPVADKFDLPKIAVTGLLLLAMTVVGASYAASFSLFIIAMALMGIGAALIPASMFPHIAKTSPKDKIGIYMGTIVASGTLGVIFGRVSMGLLTSIIGWQFSFRIVSFVLLFLSALTFLSLVEKHGEKSKNHQKLTRLYANSIRLLFNPKILSLLLAGFSLFVGFLGMVTFLTYRLIAPPFNFSSGEVGWISFAGITALIAPFAGNLSQKIGTNKIIFSSLLVCLLSFQLMGWFQSITLTVPAATVFTHWAECTKRIYRKRLISLHFILHRGRKPFFYFIRSYLAFIWLARHYHTLFYFTVDISINNVGLCVKRKGYRRRTLMIAISKIVTL